MYKRSLRVLFSPYHKDVFYFSETSLTVVQANLLYA